MATVTFPKPSPYFSGSISCERPPLLSTGGPGNQRCAGGEAAPTESPSPMGAGCFHLVPVGKDAA